MKKLIITIILVTAIFSIPTSAYAKSENSGEGQGSKIMNQIRSKVQKMLEKHTGTAAQQGDCQQVRTRKQSQNQNNG